MIKARTWIAAFTSILLLFPTISHAAEGTPIGPPGAVVGLAQAVDSPGSDIDYKINILALCLDIT